MKLKLFSLACLLFLGLTINAQNKKETVEQCVGTVTLEEAVDYTITGTTPFATSSTINIANPDAAVVFQNIRPSVVIEKYLQNINVNGIALKDNVNCRVSVYRHGAIVLPHSDTKNPDGSTFYPLTTYSGDGFTGDVNQYNNTGRNTKSDGSFPIRSFKIKRGYMVTMANNIDGTGYSHVFIANSGDREVDLSTISKGKFLADKVGFFRIFRWQWPGKLGMSDARDNKLIEMTNASWFYDWGAGNSTRTNAEYVPQRHHEAGQSNSNGYKGAWESWSTINGLHNLNTHILGQNEPDNTSGGNEVYTYVTSIPSKPREKHGDYPLVQVAKDFLYSGMRIGTFACCNPNTGWVTEYVNWCRSHNVRVDFVATHFYIGGQSPQGCIDRIKSLYDATGLPVWATEWNNGANWTTEGGFNTDAGWYSWGSGNDQKKNGEWLRDVLRRADGLKCIERLAVYNAVEGKREIWTNGAPTEAAKVLGTYQSGFAYDDANEYWMPWNYMAPEGLVLTFNKTKNRVDLSWTHNNSKQTDYAAIEIKELDGANKWVELANIGMLNKMDQKVDYTKVPELELTGRSGAIYFRIADHDNDGKVRYSNEVSVSLGSSQGNNTYQYGNLTLTNSEPITVDFTEQFSTTPAVFMGILSNANTKLYPTNIVKATNKKFTYSILPWKENSGYETTVSKQETIPFLALQDTTNYQFGELDCEVGNVKVNTKDAAEVTFRQPFPEGVTPIVIGEFRIGTSSPTTGLSYHIYDVTNTGFKVEAMYEESLNKKSIVTFPFCYLAITPGIGFLDEENKLMISAGKSDVLYGSTYRSITFENGNDTLYFKDPMIFGTTQTHNYASGIIMRRTSDVKFTDEDPDKKDLVYGSRIKRQYDATSTFTPKATDKASADDFGWIIISNYVEGGSKPTAIQYINDSSKPNNKLLINVANRRISVIGTEDYSIYSNTGVEVSKHTTLTPGIYVVKSGAVSTKVIVK